MRIWLLHLVLKRFIVHSTKITKTQILSQQTLAKKANNLTWLRPRYSQRTTSWPDLLHDMESKLSFLMRSCPQKSYHNQGVSKGRSHLLRWVLLRGMKFLETLVKSMKKLQIRIQELAVRSPRLVIFVLPTESGHMALSPKKWEACLIRWRRAAWILVACHHDRASTDIQNRETSGPNIRKHQKKGPRHQF